jgi:etoposide-induced 2.4 mRNA
MVPVQLHLFYVTLGPQSTWCSVIARRTFMLQHGNRAVVQPQHGGYTGMLNSLATSAYRVVMIFTCVVVSVGLGMIPIPRIGPFLAFLFFCWVDA